MFNITGLVPKALNVISENTTDNFGVFAAPDGHEMYLHFWPRDTIFIALELRKSSPKLSKKIVEATLNFPTDKGLFYQRYDPDCSPDPDGWANEDGKRQLDQDALKFVSLVEFDNLNLNKAEIKESYYSFLDQIKRKLTSMDVWEQKTGYFFYSTATIIWGLKSVEKAFPEFKKTHKKVLKGIIESLDSFYDEELGSFVKSTDEKILDLEVILGLNVLFDAEVDFDRKDLEKILSTLEAVEREIVVDFGDYKIPIRFKDDFWNGEIVGDSGIGRPWPMGTAMISQLYANCARLAGDLGDFDLEKQCLRNSERWLKYIKKVPSIHEFPEQIKRDGSVPALIPRPLTWCAAEILKAERLFFEAKNRNLGPN